MRSTRPIERAGAVESLMPNALSRTTVMKPAEARPEWFVLDAQGLTVGRLATQIATVLMGKHKPQYTPHVDTGDYVIVVNADQVRFSGGTMSHARHEHFTTKMAKKVYRWHTQWPGGLREVAAINLWEKHPEAVLKKAVQRMMPKSALGKRMLDKLKLYAGTTHPHQAQQPKPFPEHLLPKKSDK
jgi:large subunit ribosomal protein L13